MAEITAPVGLDTLPLTIGGTGEAIPYPVPPRRGRWQIITGPASGGYTTDLTVAQDRKLTVRLTEAPDLSFKINARLPEAAGIDELKTDVHVLWTSPSGVLHRLFRGRCGTSADGQDAARHDMTVTALGYRGMFDRRFLFEGAALNPNDSFEDGLTYWTGSGGTLELDDAQPGERLKAGKITPDGVSATVAITSDNFPADAGNTYRLSGALQNEVARTLNLQVVWKDAGGATISTDSVAVPVDAKDWTRIDRDYTAPALTTQYSIVAQMSGTPAVTDVMKVDDLRLTIAPAIASQLRFDGVDQATIAWRLIADAQSRTGGDLGISNGTTPTGFVRDRTYAYGDSVGERIQELSEVINGFEWDITPTSPSGMQLHVWSPERGSNKGVVLTPGGLIKEYSRSVSPSAYGNAIRYTGADSTIPVELEADDLATRPEGRWDLVFGNTGLLNQEALNDRAAWQLAESQATEPTYTFTLQRGAWLGPDHIWVGDTVRIVIYDGRLAVDTTQRIYEMSFSLDGKGGETVEITTGGPKRDRASRAVLNERRLKNLERR